MEDALLVSEQYGVRENASHRLGASGWDEGPLGFVVRYPSNSGSLAFNRIVIEVPSNLVLSSPYFGRAQRNAHRPRRLGANRALQQISEVQAAQAEHRRVQAEIDWITENRAQYAGRWVALVGNELIAVGDSAREVFDKTSAMAPQPVLVRVEAESLPFSGW